MPTSITAHEAQRLAELAGYTATRSKTHIIYSKPGAMSLVIPHAGKLTPWVSQFLMRATKVAEEEREAGPRIPLMVNWADQDWAVVEDKGDYWSLQSLETGRKAIAQKEECVEVVPELTKPTIYEVTHRPEEATEFTWVTVTRREIDRLRVQIDAAKASVAPLERRMAALEAALGAYTGQTEKRHYKPRDSEQKAKVKEMYAEGKDRRSIANELGISYGTVYSYTNR